MNLLTAGVELKRANKIANIIQRDLFSCVFPTFSLSLLALPQSDMSPVFLRTFSKTAFGLRPLALEPSNCG